MDWARIHRRSRAGATARSGMAPPRCPGGVVSHDIQVPGPSAPAPAPSGDESGSPCRRERTANDPIGPADRPEIGIRGRSPAADPGSPALGPRASGRERAARPRADPWTDTGGPGDPADSPAHPARKVPRKTTDRDPGPDSPRGATAAVIPRTRPAPRHWAGRNPRNRQHQPPERVSPRTRGTAPETRRGRPPGRPSGDRPNHRSPPQTLHSRCRSRPLDQAARRPPPRGRPRTIPTTARRVTG
jgi:hypothetical protein